MFPQTIFLFRSISYEFAPTQLAKTVQASYKKLGKIGTGMLNKMVAGKLPAGSSVSNLKAKLAESNGPPRKP